MLMPKRVKYRKPHSAPRIKGNATRGADVVFGEFGLKALEPKWITARQIEAARITLSRFIKKKGKLWIRVFPDKAITKHPAETRMGKGKGAPDHWVAVVKPGTILFELEGATLEDTKQAMRLASDKLPIKTKMVARR
ncbi:50S ribosomal protein L16 [Candidatus Avelusimicrobium facis]|uniref:50S ribosomal protein L16 n=1 Tax=Candidatus Avelusimicrobium facis TaxID=3416203 RepID=UPI0015B52360